MRIHRLYTPESLDEGVEIRLDGKPAHYLSRVLRLAESTELVLFNGDGHDYQCVLVGFERDSVRVRVQARIRNDTESPLRITLAQAISRGDRMDYCLQKSTELGVSTVQLLVSTRVEVKLSENRLEKRMAHWRGVMQSACEQCGRATVPELHAPISLDDWVGLPGRKMVLDASGKIQLSQAQPGDNVSIAAGPEGGFEDAELGLLQDAGVETVRMGPRILRSETAGPAAIAVLQSMSGDMKPTPVAV